MPSNCHFRWSVVTMCRTAILLVACGCEGGSNSAADSGVSTRSCMTDIDCSYSQVCVRPPSDTDAGSNIGTEPGVCECRDELCPQGSGCIDRSSGCRAVPCSKTAPCQSVSTALYCDYTAHTCNRLNGQCGTVGAETYGCPNFFGWLSSGFYVTCVSLGSNMPGLCQFQNTHLPTPGADKTGTDVVFDAPSDGHTFESEYDVVFGVHGTTLPLFVFVTTGMPTDPTTAAQNAIWGAAIPQSSLATQVRQVGYREGNAIVEGVWQSSPGVLPHDVELYAMAYAVNADTIAQVSSEVVRFRIGSAGVAALSPCDVEGDSTGYISPSARTQACSNTQMPLTCIGGVCQRLCLTNVDCDGGECDFDSQFGILYCRLQ